MSLPETCIRRPVMTILLMVTFIVMGFIGFRELPVSALPQVDFPTIQITANLSGANPETMGASVAAPLERQFATIAGISSMTSISGQGLTQITIQFDLARDIDGAALDVQSAITAALRRLPIEMTTPPSFRKVNPADTPVLFLSLTSDTMPLWQVNEFADIQIAQRISTLPGVAQVLNYGQQKFAVRVQADPNALASAGISFDEVQAAVAAANSSKPVGTLQGDRTQFTVQASGQLTRADQYRDIVVTYRNGNPVRLGDIATVLDSVENNKIAGWMNGKRSLTLAVMRQPGANTIELVDRVTALVPSFRQQLPASVQLDVIIDRSTSIRESVADVEHTLILTIVLVVLVIFAFLRSFWATVIPALALPISLIGTCAGMYLFGYSIDNLSLLAITLAVGFVVDDAIVMLENIVRHIENGMKPYEAALRGSREIVFTIISITGSLVAVFIPIMFMGGIVGRLFREFAVTISMTILISGFVSLTLTPLMCSRLLRPVDHNHKHGALYRASEHVFDGMLAAYAWALRHVLQYRLLTLLATFASFGLSAWLFMTMPKGFFPTEDTGMLIGITEASQDVSFTAMAEAQQKAAAIIQADPAVRVVNSTVGASGPNTAMNSGRMFIGLKPRSERDASATEIIQRLRPQLAQLREINTFMQPIQNINLGGRLSKSQYQYTVNAPSLTLLQEYAPKIEQAMRGLPNFLDVTSDLQMRNPLAFVDIDRQKAAALNVTVDSIRGTLYAAFGTRQISTIYTASNDYQVILEADPKFQQSLSDFSKLYVRSTTGQVVPLDALATIRRTAGPVNVNHTSLLPSVTLSFNLTQGYSLGEAVSRLTQLERELNLPPTITTSYQGTAQVFQQALQGQGLLLLAAVFVIYVVLGVLYESFIHPLTILSGLPAAGLGALLTLKLFNMDLSVIAMIGIVLLIGIVKKNAIMMIDFALQRQNEGETSPAKAITDACLMRFRPIMMTTMAAIMGTLPIALGLGAGAELRQPLGLAVVGGLCVSQLLTLFITPVVFLYFEDLRIWATRPKATAAASLTTEHHPAPGE